MASVGTKLGPYELSASIGAGGMGEVYRAHDARLGRDVAVKILPASFADDPERLRRFEQEARAAAALNHPNLLAVYDVGTQDGRPYIVSELLEGETLRQRLQSGPMPVRKVTEVGAQIARGLAAAHEKGIIHRDLKPDNIFIIRDGRVKILDFGLAKLYLRDSTGLEVTSGPTLASKTTPGMVMGTIGYMSPEQVRGQELDHRTDIFSFGTIFYEMITGKRAFEGKTSADTMSAILKEDVSELSDSNRNVPPTLDRIARHCLEKNPEERFHSASDIAFALEGLSGATSGSAAVAAMPAAARRGLLYPAIAVVALIAFAMGLLVRGMFAPAPLPRFHQITFRRGNINTARFAPDGQTVVYQAAWEGNAGDVYSGRTDSPGERVLGMPDTFVLAISSSGEMAIRTNNDRVAGFAWRGTLERVPLAGGAPRPLLDDVGDASWGPTGRDIAVTRYMHGDMAAGIPDRQSTL